MNYQIVKIAYQEHNNLKKDLNHVFHVKLDRLKKIKNRHNVINAQQVHSNQVQNKLNVQNVIQVHKIIKQEENHQVFANHAKKDFILMIKEKIIVNLVQLINIQIELEQNIVKIVLKVNLLKQQEILNVNHVKRVLVEKILVLRN